MDTLYLLRGLEYHDLKLRKAVVTPLIYIHLHSSHLNPEQAPKKCQQEVRTRLDLLGTKLMLLHEQDINSPNNVLAQILLHQKLANSTLAQRMQPISVPWHYMQIQINKV